MAIPPGQPIPTEADSEGGPEPYTHNLQSRSTTNIMADDAPASPMDSELSDTVVSQVESDIVSDASERARDHADSDVLIPFPDLEPDPLLPAGQEGPAAPASDATPIRL